MEFISHLALIPAFINTFLATVLLLRKAAAKNIRLLAVVFGITALYFWNRYFMLHEFRWSIYAPFLLFPLIWSQGPLLYHYYTMDASPRWKIRLYLISLIPGCMSILFHAYLMNHFPEFRSLQHIKNQSGLVGNYSAVFMCAVSVFNGGICTYLFIKVWQTHSKFDRATIASLLLLYSLVLCGAALKFFSIIHNPILILDILFACVGFFLILYLLFDTEIKDARHAGNQKYARHSLDNAVARDYQHQLLKHMEEIKPYLENELSLHRLAEQLNIPAHHLSIVINRDLETNFFDFLNHYRIAEARRLLDDPRNHDENLLSICYASGFQSRSAFNKAFKRICGMAPSEYRKSK